MVYMRANFKAEKAIAVFKNLSKPLKSRYFVPFHSQTRSRSSPQEPSPTASLKSEWLLPCSSLQQWWVQWWPVQGACYSGSHHFTQFCRDVCQLHKIQWQSTISLGFIIFHSAKPDCFPDLVFLSPSSLCRAPGSSLSLPSIFPLLVPEPSQLLLLPSGTAFLYITASLPLCLCSNLYSFFLIYCYIIFLFSTALTCFLTL